MGSLVSDSVPNLTGGVSQQPAAVRRENQFEDQLNAYATPVDGLAPRRPTYHIRWISSLVGPDTFLHFINRDPTEQYAVAIYPNGSSIRVWDLLTGIEKSVSTPNTLAYVTDAKPKDALKAITVADHTFVVNTTKEVKTFPTNLAPSNGKEALINVKQGNYGKTYKVIVDGNVAATFQTPSGSNASDAFSIDTVSIASTLITLMTPNLPGWEIERWGSSVWLRKADKSDFSLQCEDGYSGLAMIPIKDEVARFTDLPIDAKPGFIIGITGDQGLEGDKYYLAFSPSTTGSTGVWKECAAPGVLTSIDWDTMPYRLVRNTNGTFTFSNGPWGTRGVGDLTTNPWPSFVGRKIKDMFFVRNRLGMLSGENAITSRSGEFYEFFRRTVTTLLDDDPVDIASTSSRVANMSWAVPFDRNVIMFADQGQYEFGAQGILTPKTAAIAPTSEYESSDRARPSTTGTSVFFAVEADGYAQIREYFNDGSQVSKFVAFNTTEHVPRLIPAGVYKITASRSENIVAVLTSGDPTAIYVYSFLGPANDRVQSAWTRWEMTDTVRYVEFIKSDIKVVIEREGQTWLENIPMAAGKKDPLVDYLVYLDRKVDETALTGAYDAATDLTTVGLPYSASGIRVIARKASDYSGPVLPGQDVPIDSTSGANVKLKGDHRLTPMWFGFTPLTRITLSTIFPREAGDGGAKNSITTGRLQLRYLTFVLSKTSYLRVEVKPIGRAMYRKTFNGRVVGAETTIIGATPLYSGKFKVPIMSNAATTTITIVHDSPLPLNILSMEWEGMYTTRSQKVG